MHIKNGYHSLNSLGEKPSEVRKERPILVPVYDHRILRAIYSN